MIAGRYTQVRPIGRGGTGSVWLGRDEVLGRLVALKRIGVLPGGDTTDLARAEREATLAARLHHPHVVSVFDVVADEATDTHWLVMEHVDGPSLAEVVRDHGALPPEHAARLVGQVADALATAHAAGITHRDVKPSNVMLDPSGAAKLTDFGIARLTSDPALTQTGMVTGSPAYLAPEVAAGGRGEQAVDVWSLGALLYCLLAGRAPYDGGEALGTLYRIVNEPPPRLPDAGRLAPVLEGTMVKDPTARWSMAQVRDHLVAGAEAPAPATRAAPAADVTEVVPVVGRRRRTAPLLLVLLLVAALTVGGYLAGRSLLGDEPNQQAAPTATPTPSASPTPSPSPSPSSPTAEGMEAFISDYVTTVGDDPSASWQMLTPKFQAESGGFETYSSFWGPASNGRLVEVVAADPQTLVISYQVQYDTWDNGPGPTVLQLTYDDGTYLIDGESSEGFAPAG